MPCERWALVEANCTSQVRDAGAGSGQDRGASGGSQSQSHLQATSREGGPGVSVSWELFRGAASPTACSGTQTREQHCRARYTAGSPW